MKAALAEQRAVNLPNLKIATHAISEWAELQPVWQMLVEASECSFFLTTSWIETWLETFGPHLNPSILIAENEGAVAGACLVAGRRVGLGFLTATGISINAAGEPSTDTTYTEFNEILSLPGVGASGCRGGG